jgi:DNA invertase Pin-like site-specific DNA recombinase
MVNSTTNKSAVIYARVSSIGDRQNTDRQVLDLRAYARTNGYDVIKVFTEHISGGKRNEERAVLCECLDYCDKHKVNTLLISELSRLGRKVEEVQKNVIRCKDNGLNIYFQKENLSIFQADGSENIFLPIMIAVLGTCAEIERENIKFRLNSGRSQYIANGGKLGRKEGYRKPKDQKAEEYKGVIKRLKNGEKLRDIAKLEDVGISTVQRVKKEFNL